MKKFIGIVVFTAIFGIQIIYADRGLAPFDLDIQIFEPIQRAMIAWNGSEEILLLTTDVSASDSTQVLEILPLPSEPEVKKGDLETFEKAIELINRKIIALLRDGRGKSYEKVPPAEITFHEKIGAHDISVAHLINAEGFVDWLKKYLRSMGVEKNIISDEMKNLIEEYIDDKFEWFVFDIISLTKETVTNEPIQYRFKTNSLFYPMKITSTGEGHTSIELLILTPRLLRNFPGVSIEMIHLDHDPIAITDEELKELNKDMHELLSDYKEMRLRIWRIEGELKSFAADLIAN